MGGGENFKNIQGIWESTLINILQHLWMQTPFFFLSDNVTDSWIRRKKKHSATPPRIEPGSSDCRSDALTTELRSHDRNCVWIFCLSPSFQFFFSTRWPACSSLQTRDQRKLAGFSYNCSNRKFVPVGTILIKLLSFLSDKCELTAGSDQKKKKT